MSHVYSKISVLIFLVFNTGCSQDSSAPGNITSGAKHVSPTSDINTSLGLGDGNKDSPSRTISHVLSLLEDSGPKNIYIDGGVYSANTGEIFPLNIPSGVNLFRSNKNDDNVKIIGSGVDESGQHATIILNGNSQLNSLDINSEGQIGVLSRFGSNTILSSNIHGNRVGVGVIDKSTLSIQNTSIYKNTHAGIESSGTSNITLSSTKIYDNTVGSIISDFSKVKVMANQSSNNNEISGNKNCDLFHEGHSDLQLVGITWDDDVFNFPVKGFCENGNNIVNIGTANISYQYIPSETSTLFNTKRAINIISPGFGDTIFSNTPTFSYSSFSTKHIMLALWDTPPIVVDNAIRNPNDIIWYWHSGMKNSPIGNVTYNKGAVPLNGDLNSTSPLEAPQPLKKGRPYYFAVWEWDDEGIVITGSSLVHYFTISPL